MNSEVTFDVSIMIQQRETQWSLTNNSLAIHFSYTMFLPYLFQPFHLYYRTLLLTEICWDIRYKNEFFPLFFSPLVRCFSGSLLSCSFISFSFMCVCGGEGRLVYMCVLYSSYVACKLQWWRLTAGIDNHMGCKSDWSYTEGNYMFNTWGFDRFKALRHIICHLYFPV